MDWMDDPSAATRHRDWYGDPHANVCEHDVDRSMHVCVRCDEDDAAQGVVGRDDTRCPHDEPWGACDLCDDAMDRLPPAEGYATLADAEYDATCHHGQPRGACMLCDEERASEGEPPC